MSGLRKLVYWYARCKDDGNCYSLRGRRKRDVVAALECTSDPSAYGPIVKVEVEYTDAFDLMMSYIGEGGALCEPEYFDV